MNETTNKYTLLRTKRKNQILQTAKQLILKNTIGSVTMSDIAKACKISRQTLYKYFESFDAILFAIQSDIIESFTFSNQDDITKFLCAMADEIFHYYKTNYDDFLFICLFDVYVRTHKIDSTINRRYRNIVYQQLSGIELLKNADSHAKSGYSLKEIFICGMHMIWGFITRLAVLGDSYEKNKISEERALLIVKDMIINYLKDNGIA